MRSPACPAKAPCTCGLRWRRCSAGGAAPACTSRLAAIRPATPAPDSWCPVAPLTVANRKGRRCFAPSCMGSREGRNDAASGLAAPQADSGDKCDARANECWTQRQVHGPVPLPHRPLTRNTAEAAPTSMGSPSAVPLECICRPATSAARAPAAPSASRSSACCAGPLGAVRLLARPLVLTAEAASRPSACWPAAPASPAGRRHSARHVSPRT